MALTGTRNDPILSFRFEVQLGALGTAGFSECSGFALETETFDYLEGGQNAFVHRLPVRTKQANLVFKRGVVDRLLWQWYYDLTQGKIRLISGSVLVKGSSGDEPEMVWQFRDAYPVKFTGPDLSAAQAAVAVETLELAHKGLTRTK